MKHYPVFPKHSDDIGAAYKSLFKTGSFDFGGIGRASSPQEAMQIYKNKISTEYLPTGFKLCIRHVAGFSNVKGYWPFYSDYQSRACDGLSWSERKNTEWGRAIESVRREFQRYWDVRGSDIDVDIKMDEVGFDEWGEIEDRYLCFLGYKKSTIRLFDKLYGQS
ncbi:MAG: hypothetical protein JJ939_12140 [Alphaproteobacteria bacterium]|nr:hypothetical protein [Alphaproteobacteria bacterium]MBO6629163.1 hypothetical protein [Alphaproteobacteria bacterium]